MHYAFIGRPNSEDYNKLKSIANEVAKPAEANNIPEKNTLATTTLTDDSFIVDVENDVAHVQAIYPVTIETILTNNETITKIVHIYYTDVTYSQFTDIQPLFIYVIVGTYFFAFCVLDISLVFMQLI